MKRGARTAGRDEPTLLDVDASSSSATRSGADETPTLVGTSSASGLTAARRGPESTVTTASATILQAEEQTRTVALLRLVLAVAVAGMIAVWLPERDAPGRWPSTVIIAVTSLVSLWLLFELRKTARLDRRKVLVFGLCCVAAILSVAYYVGVFSPAIIAMYVGIYFFGASDSPASGWAIYASGAGGYLLLDLLAMAGVISVGDSVVPLAQTELSALVAITLVCQVLFATTFWMARRSRAATRAAFERLERASRQIRQRDALLDEARQDLDHERAAKVGRYTDQEVGRYVIGEIIGRGAMGEIYRAWERGTDRAVAVKFLSSALTGDLAAAERFFRESDVASHLESEHIVSVLDQGVAGGGAPFLVMELLEGRDLAAILRERKRLGMSGTLELVSEVAQALAVADEAGVVHRDLKPQNLFLSERGTERRWKVLDFGVAKLLQAGSELTMGAAVGTPSYMSPEQARGEDVDHRADVFALGIVAYRTLTGRPAFTGPDSPTTLYNVVHVQPARPSHFVKLSPDVERVLALALAKDRERRFSSALMFATALREAARHRLDERLRRDADALLASAPWGSDVLDRPRH